MDAQYHLQRGIDYASEDEFRKAVKLSPTNPAAHYQLANYYARYAGGVRLNQAYEEYKKAALFSDKKFQRNILEEIYKINPQDYPRLKEIMPDTAAAKHSLAEFLRDKKLYDESISEYREAVLLAGNSNNDLILEDSYNWIAILYMWQEKYEYAVENFNKALDIVKDRAYKSWILRNLGNTYTNMKNFDKAKSAYEQAIKNDPANWVNYYGIGSVYEAMELNSKADRYFKMALRFNPPKDYKQQILRKLSQLKDKK